MPKELDLIILTADIQGQDGDLKAGDVGTVVHLHPGGEALVVEFTTLHGDTVAVATLLPSQVRLVTDEDIIHARKLAAVV